MHAHSPPRPKTSANSLNLFAGECHGSAQSECRCASFWPSVIVPSPLLGSCFFLPTSRLALSAFPHPGATLLLALLFVRSPLSSFSFFPLSCLFSPLSLLSPLSFLRCDRFTFPCRLSCHFPSAASTLDGCFLLLLILDR